MDKACRVAGGDGIAPWNITYVAIYAYMHADVDHTAICVCCKDKVGDAGSTDGETH